MIQSSQRDKRSIPPFMKSYLSPQARARESELMRTVFSKCPACNKYGLKPNYPLSRVKNPAIEIPEIIKNYGKKCFCGFISNPNEGQKTII